jgi:hypothetical protein
MKKLVLLAIVPALIVTPAFANSGVDGTRFEHHHTGHANNVYRVLGVQF